MSGLVKIERAEGELTREQFQGALPKRFRGRVTDKVVKDCNKVMTDETMQEAFRNNLLGYASVLDTGKFKLQEYINAVRYCSYKMMGETNLGAFTKTFPDRYQSMVDKEYEDRHIAGVVSVYNKSQLVTKIMEQTLIPTHILNQDIYQKAVNHLAHLMLYAKSEKVQSDSAGKLVDALRPPETQKIELDVVQKEDSAIAALRETTQKLVEEQRRMIESGQRTPREVAESKLNIIDVEPE